MIELHNPKPLGVPYRNKLSYRFAGTACTELLVSFGLFQGFTPLEPPATCGQLITEAARITDENYSPSTAPTNTFILRYSITS